MAEAQRGEGQEGRWGQRDQEGTSKNKTSVGEDQGLGSRKEADSETLLASLSHTCLTEPQHS